MFVSYQSIQEAISLENRVRRFRRKRKWSQSELAQRSGIPRSTLSALENGRHDPSLPMARKLADTFGVDIEELFPRDPGFSPEWAWPPPDRDSRYVLSKIRGRLLAYPLANEATGALLADGSGPLSEPSTVGGHEPSSTLVLAGCDPAVGLLAPFLRRQGVRLVAYTRPNQAALRLLKRGRVHAAGLHCGTSGSRANAEYAARDLEGSFQLLRGTIWELGIVTHPRIEAESPRALLRSDHRWINRPPGSGARQCLKRMLGTENIERPRGYNTRAADHSSVVEVIRSGVAEVGISLPVCASAGELPFVGVQEEAYDWCVRKDMADEPRIVALGSVLSDRGYRKQLSKVPGHDPGTTGEQYEYDAES